MRYEINEKLADERGLDQETREVITVIGNRIIDICDRPLEFYDDHKKAATAVRALETSLQVFWGFEPDEKYRRLEFMIEGCECPKSENMENFGRTEFRWMERSCPVHGATGENEEC